MNMSYPNPDSLFPFAAQTTMNREQLQDRYIRADIDAMDLDDMYTILYDLLDDKLSNVSDEELMEDIKEYHPDLLEDNWAGGTRHLTFPTIHPILGSVQTNPMNDTLINFRDREMEIADDLGAHQEMLLCCHKYMSQDDVEDMLKMNDYLNPPDMEEDEDEDDSWYTDRNSKASYHHYW